MHPALSPFSQPQTSHQSSRLHPDIVKIKLVERRTMTRVLENKRVLRSSPSDKPFDGVQNVATIGQETQILHFFSQDEKVGVIVVGVQELLEDVDIIDASVQAPLTWFRIEIVDA